MKKLLIFILCIIIQTIFVTCKTSEKKSDVKNNKDEQVIDSKKNDPNDKKAIQGEITTGWSDSDTYIVNVVSTDESTAIDLAKTKILKDIIKVRYKIYGTHERLRVIKEEFAGPLKKGEVIKKKQLDNGVEIYFQIREKDLKKKFETK